MKRLWALLAVFAFLAGCSAKQSRTLSAGMGTMYQENLCATYTVTIHDEEHVPDGAVEKFIGIFTNISGIPQAVLGALTSPERAFSESMDGDRREVVLSFGLKDCDKANLQVIVESINDRLDAEGINAEAVFSGGSGE